MSWRYADIGQPGRPAEQALGSEFPTIDAFIDAVADSKKKQAPGQRADGCNVRNRFLKEARARPKGRSFCLLSPAPGSDAKNLS